MKAKFNLNMKNSLLAVILLVLCMLCGLSAGAKAATPVEANGKLSIKGSNVVNEKGQTFVIKGVSTHGLAWFPGYVNKAAFKELRDKWGVNTIRLALYTAEYHGYCKDGDKKELKKLVENGVSYATELGMYVIIDWHILSDGNPLTYKSQSIAFFKEIAGKYAGQKNVLYEICNEPNGSGGTWTNIKSYANSVIKTIREVNKDAIIIVGTPTWSQDVDKANASKITGYKNIAYSLHFYAATHTDALRSKLEAAVKSGLPVIVTEFGITSASGNGGVSTAQGNKWMTLLDKYHIGRVCWNLSNKNESSALIKSSCSKKSGWVYSDLSEQGKWLVATYKGSLAGSSSSAGGSTNTGTAKPVVTQPAKVIAAKTAVCKKPIPMKAAIKEVNRWKSGSKVYTQYDLVIKNTGKKTCKTWAVAISFKQNVKVSSKWCGKYAVKAKKLTVTPLSWNKKLKKNQSVKLGFILAASTRQSISAMKVASK